MQSIETIISNWLSVMGIKVSRKYLKQQLQTHPDYPSMLCITDTLESLGIEYAAVQIEKEHLPEIPVPFLAHLTGNGGEWVMVKNRDNLKQQFPKFFDRWRGTVLAVEKTEGWHNADNERELEKERKGKFHVLIFSGIISFLVVTAMLTAGTMLVAGLLISSAAGILISWLIESKDLGIDNKLADQICGTTADCNAVIQSKAAKIPGALSWGDIGLIWFSFQFLFLLICAFGGNTQEANHLFSLCVLFYLPFVCFSLYYQWQIAKQWCRLCLIVVGIILLQSVLLLLNILINGVQWPGYRTTATVILLLTVGIIFWLPIKRLLVEKRKLESDKWGLQRFKYNIDIFSAILSKQRKVDTHPWEFDLQIGNRVGAVQIIVVCNPYCGPCARAHEVFHQLLEVDKDLGLTIRFAINASNREDRKNKVVEYIYQLVETKRGLLKVKELENYQRTLLYDWFKCMDFTKYKSQYPLSNECLVHKILEKHEKWGNDSKIVATPTIFVNGYELPKNYSFEDIAAISRRLKVIKIEKSLIDADLIII